MKLHIESMTCGGCARSVTAAVKEIDPTATVEIDVPSRIVQIQTTESAERITQVLDAAGFPPKLQG